MENLTCKMKYFVLALQIAHWTLVPQAVMQFWTKNYEAWAYPWWRPVQSNTFNMPQYHLET